MRVLWEDKLALQEQIATIQKELQACKDNLFRLQPVSQLPDSTIAQRLEDLNVQICDWIDVEISRSMDENGQPGNQPTLFHHGEDRNAKKFLAVYPEFGGEYYVRSLLQQYLQQVLFNDKILLFALDQDLSIILQNIEHGMSQLEPSREATTIRGWRSETLSSILKTQNFSDILKAATLQLAEETYAILRAVFPVINNRQTSFDNLYHKIIKLAVNLAITIQTSMTTYQFECRAPNAGPFVLYPVSKLSLGRCQMIDVATGKTLKPDSPIVSDSRGIIGERIMTLSPALYRRTNNNFIPLSQEIILVELHKPLGRRHAKKESTSAQLG